MRRLGLARQASPRCPRATVSVTDTEMWAEPVGTPPQKAFTVTGHLFRPFLPPQSRDSVDFRKIFLKTSYALMTHLLFCQVGPAGLLEGLSRVLTEQHANCKQANVRMCDVGFPVQKVWCEFWTLEDPGLRFILGSFQKVLDSK